MRKQRGALILELDLSRQRLRVEHLKRVRSVMVSSKAKDRSITLEMLAFELINYILNYEIICQINSQSQRFEV